MEFDSDTKINDYLNAEIGKRKLHYQNIFESNQRNFRNIFKTRFPIIEGKINNVRYLSIPTPEILVIITRRNSLLSEISIRTMPNFLRQGYGLKILEQAIQHEIDLGLIVVFVTEQANLAANALINKFIPDRQYQERMVIN
jgi:GNAT superfamily N-acetyltransferase